MNILVLNGSPRPHGNTAAMVSEFVKGAGERAVLWLKFPRRHRDF